MQCEHDEIVSPSMKLPVNYVIIKNDAFKQNKAEEEEIFLLSSSSKKSWDYELTRDYW